MNAFRVIAAILIIGLLTKPLGFIPASILAAIVMVLTGFFQTKSVIDGVEMAADSEKAAIPSAREEKPLSFTPRDMSVRDSSDTIKGRAPISDSVLVALTFLTAIRQAELGQNEAGVTRRSIFENAAKTFKPYLQTGLSSREVEYLNHGIDALIDCRLAGEENGKIYWTQGGTIISAYSIAHQNSPTFEEDIKVHKVLDGLLESIGRDKRFVSYDIWIKEQPLIQDI